MEPRHFAGQAHLIFAVVTVFVATFTLLYVFTAISSTTDSCHANPTQDICKVFNGIGLPLVIILIVIAGLILVISTVAYILISA